MTQPSDQNGSATEAFVTSRALDFLTKTDLERQAGVQGYFWGLMIVKEALDNALDACEEAKVVPKISVYVAADHITVYDNGPGIPHATVRRVLDFATTVSSNRHRVRPTRGQQGNAWKTFLAVSYVTSGEFGKVEVVTPEGHLILTISLDSIRAEPVTEVTTGTEIVKSGTKLTVWLPDKARHLTHERGDEFLQLIEAFAAFNPHAEIFACVNGIKKLHERATSEFEKWDGKDKSSPYWTSAEDISNLLAATIRLDEASGRSTPLREFISKEFHGVTSSAKPPQILAAAGMPKVRVADLVKGKQIDADSVDKLLAALRDHTKPVKPKKMGVIGANHFRSIVAGEDDDFFKYVSRADIDENGLPFVVEVAFAYREDLVERTLLTGLNFSATLKSPIRNLDYTTDFGELLEDQRCGMDSQVAIALHIVCPKLSFTDRAKQSLDLTGALAEAVKDTVIRATAEYARHVKSQERTSQRDARDMKERLRRETQKTSLKDACFAAVPLAIPKVSGNGRYRDIQARNLYYVVRELIQGQTDKTLTQKRFDAILKEYERRHGIIEALYREARGFLREPHTGKEVKLGTLDVRSYTIPPHLFNRVLFIEKRGLMPLISQAMIAEKYDILIICGEGYGTEAMKMLLARASEEGMKIFTLHDADPYGYHLSDKMRSRTRRAQGVEIVDIGLKLDDAIGMGLQLENFVRTKALPSELQLRTKLEKKHFQGESVFHGGKRKWKCQRVELNALAADPDRFIEYICKQLEKNGCTKKLVPKKPVVLQHAKDHLQARLNDELADKLWQRLNLSVLAQELAAEIMSDTESDLDVRMQEFKSQLSTRRWTNPIDDWIDTSLERADDEITSRLRVAMGAAGQDGDA